MQLDWKVVVLGSIVFAGVAALTYAGRLPTTVITAVASGLVGWLVPSPLSAPKKDGAT